MSSFFTSFDYINFKNGKSGFLTAENSNISVINSTFDNSHLNFTNSKSFITLNQPKFPNNFNISKCLFNRISSLDFGGVILFKNNIFIYFL